MPEYAKKFDDFTNGTLIIVDVQEPFSEYFPENYVEELNDLASKMNKVYQIWDSNDESKKDYTFPNETMSFEKQFGGKPEIDLIVPNAQQNYIQDEKDTNFFNESGDTKSYQLQNGDILLYVGMGGQGPGHEWFIIPTKIKDLFISLQDSEDMIYLVGGANQECLYDIEVALHHLDVKFQKLDDYVYSANP